MVVAKSTASASTVSESTVSESTASGPGVSGVRRSVRIGGACGLFDG